MPGPIPHPTPLYRLMHIDNLKGCLDRGGVYAPNHWPDNGLAYRTIHNERIQDTRHVRRIACGPGGTIHDYVSFYFGYLSPMQARVEATLADYEVGMRRPVAVRRAWYYH